MANPVRNIRISDDAWKQAKKDAVDNDMSLQEWVTLSLLKSHSGDGVGMVHVNYDKHQTTVYAKDGEVVANG